MKKLLFLLSLFIGLNAYTQILPEDQSNRVLVGIPVQVSTDGEVAFGLELGIVPVQSPVYFTANACVYNAKKDPQRQWTTIEAGARLYYFKHINDVQSIHLFGQYRFVSQGSENNFIPVQDTNKGNGYSQWSPGIGAAWLISLFNPGNGYCRLEIEKTFGKDVNRFRFGLSFVGLL